MSNINPPTRAAADQPTGTARIGVIGGGQLAQMLHQAAIGLGLECIYLGTDSTDPVALAGGTVRIGGARPQEAAVRALAAEVDVITFEHELVDLAVLFEMESAGVRFAPSPATLARVIDKAEMRRATTAAGIAAPHWEVVQDPDELRAAVGSRTDGGGGVVLKATTGGYDGRGVVLVPPAGTAEATAEIAIAEGAALLEHASELLVEDLVPLDAEIAVVVVRDHRGELRSYEPVATIQADGQCREVRLPSGLDDDLVNEARRIAERAAEAVGVVGLLAVELFVSDGRLLLNELAARPHNSAHLTIEAAVTSQFENHLRAVAGLPLGPTETTVAAATMVNLIGDDTGRDPRHHLPAGLAADAGAHLHLYAKQVRPERKVGHVTVCAVAPTDPSMPFDTDTDTDTDTSARAWRVAEALGASQRGRTS
jgi:5-(carboxyamino)imidazole ribonucleotide synthase